MVELALEEQAIDLERDAVDHPDMTSRRGFLVRAGLLTAAGVAVWRFRDPLLRPIPRVEGPASGDWTAFATARVATPVIDVRIAGRTVRALLDSGAQASAVDAAFAAEARLTTFPLPLIAVGAGGAAVVGRGASLDLEAGGLALRGLRAAALDLGPLARSDALAIPLVLGQDVLGALVADIDFPKRRLRLHRAEGFAPPPGAQPLPARSEGRALVADLEVEGAPVTGMIDTGASAALSVRLDVARQIGLLDGRPVRRSQAIALGGMVDSGAVTVTRARLGRRSLDGETVHLYPDAEVRGWPLAGLAARPPAALIGSGAFADERVLLDLSRGRLHRIGPAELFIGGEPD